MARGKLLQPIRSTTQIWGVTRHHYANFHPRFLDVISRGNQWWHPEMSFFFSGSKMVDFLVITVFFSWPLSSGLYQRRKKGNSSDGSSDGGGFAEKTARPKSTHQSKCYISSSWPILGDPGTISRVGINGGESFQERAREPLRCYSTTHSNTCLWLFLLPIGGQHLWRCFRDLLIRGTYYLQTRLYALPLWLVQESFLQKEFSAKLGPTKPKKSQNNFSPGQAWIFSGSFSTT